MQLLHKARRLPQLLHLTGVASELVPMASASTLPHLQPPLQPQLQPRIGVGLALCSVASAFRLLRLLSQPHPRGFQLLRLQSLPHPRRVLAQQLLSPTGAATALLLMANATQLRYRPSLTQLRTQSLRQSLCQLLPQSLQRVATSSGLPTSQRMSIPPLPTTRPQLSCLGHPACQLVLRHLR